MEPELELTNSPLSETGLSTRIESELELTNSTLSETGLSARIESDFSPLSVWSSRSAGYKRITRQPRGSVSPDPLSTSTI